MVSNGFNRFFSKVKGYGSDVYSKKNEHFKTFSRKAWLLTTSPVGLTIVSGVAGSTITQLYNKQSLINDHEEARKHIASQNQIILALSEANRECNQKKQDVNNELNMALHEVRKEEIKTLSCQSTLASYQLAFHTLTASLRMPEETANQASDEVKTPVHSNFKPK